MKKQICFFKLVLFFLFSSSAFAAKVTFPVNSETIPFENPVPVSLDWDEGWFKKYSPFEYHHDVARVACLLSEIAYTNVQIDPELNQIKNVYKAMGIKNSSMEFHYDLDYDAAGLGSNQVAFSFASKEVDEIGSNGKKKHLVFVVIRGTPFEANEWISNVNVADSSRKETLLHEGFFLAETQVHKAFIYYLLKMQINPDESYFLISGHSRGAAIANLLGANLLDEGFFRAENLFVYTFASPNISQEAKTSDEKYNYIWNIVNPEDIVPTVPMRKGDWNFRKYGNTKVFANRWNTSEEIFEENYIPRINKYFRYFMDKDYCPFNTGFFIPAMMTKILVKLYPSIKRYYGSSFGLRQFAEKILWSSFAPSKKGEKKSKTTLERVFDYANKKTEGLVDYSSQALLDMHICTSYLSWLLALEDDELYSEKMCSILIIKGPYESAIFNSKNEVVLRIIDGMPQFKSMKVPVIAVPSPIGVIIGVPSCEEFLTVVYKDSLIPTMIPTKIEHYDAEGYITEICPKKCLFPHKGMAYHFTIGETTALNSRITAHKSHNKITRKFIKQAKLKQQDVFRVQPEFTIDTDFRFEGGLRLGTQMIHGNILTGQSLTDFGSSLAINMGLGHEETLVDRIMIDIAAYGKFLIATGDLEENENRFNFIPSARFTLSYKPLHRQAFFVSGVFDFAINGFNNKAFASDVRNTNFGSIYLSEGVDVIPSIRFGIRF